MPSRRGGTRRTVGLLALVAALGGAVIVLMLLDSQLSILATRGSSMVPHFRQGDLAVTVATGTYRVGDIAAYRPPGEDELVLHRIVSSAGGRYTFKGDNNDWKDPVHPGKSDLVGRLWFRIPHAGMVANVLKAPGRTWMITAGLFLLLVGGGTEHHRRRRRRRGAGSDRSTRAAAPKLPPPSELSALGSALGWPIATLVAAVLLTGMTFSRAATRETTVEHDATQTAEWGYSATAPTGTTYPDGVVSTGSPIFLRLVQQIDFSLSYELSAEDRMHNVAGSYSIDAVVGVGSWSRTIELQPLTRFGGAAFSTEVTLDVPRMQALVSAAQAETGVASGTATIDLVPKVRTNGFADGVPISVDYDTPLEMQLSPLDLTPTSTPDDTGDALEDSTTIPYERPVVRDEKYEMFGRSISVGRARLVTAAGLIASLIWVAIAATNADRLRRKGAGARLAARYETTIVDVTSLPPAAATAVEVVDMAALARIAERAERLILHHVEGSRHVFLVEDDPSAYCYRLDDATVGAPTRPLPPSDVPAMPRPPLPPPYGPPLGPDDLAPAVDPTSGSAPPEPADPGRPLPEHLEHAPPGPPPYAPDHLTTTPASIAAEPPTELGFDALLGGSGVLDALLAGSPADAPTNSTWDAGVPPTYEPPEPEQAAMPTLPPLPEPPSPESSELVTQSLDQALRLTALTADEQTEMGIAPTDDAAGTDVARPDAAG